MAELTLEQYQIHLNSGLGLEFVGHYKKNRACQLALLCDKYGSDKGSLSNGQHPYPWPAHTYTDIYSRLFSHCRNHIQYVFECGLGTNNPNVTSSMGTLGKPGASLRVWRDYFPNAKIIGADIDRAILFDEERINTFYVDQTNPDSIAHLWQNANVNAFDFMLDDGLHTYEAGICLFEHSIEKLSPTGIYVIEDVLPESLLVFKKYFADKPYQVDYINLIRPNLNLGDNNLVVIRKNE